MPPKDSVDLVHSGLALDVADDVDDASVAAAGDYDKALIPEVDGQRLVVVDPGVGLPLAVYLGVLTGEAWLEFGGALYLTGYEHTAVDDEAGAAFDDEFDVLLFEVADAGRESCWSRDRRGQ